LLVIYLLHLNTIGSKAPLPQAVLLDETANRSQKWSTLQICIVVTVVSVTIHLAIPHIPLLVKPLSAWLFQRLLAWGGADGVSFDAIRLARSSAANITDSG
jgi:hypothetical protein